MELSIVIPVADDTRIRSCIQSIDEDVEVIVSLNKPTEEIRSIVKSFGVKYCEISERNLGAALDEGIKNATNERVLLNDSDCTFKSGCIRLLYNGLEGYKLAKGRVIFEHSGFISTLVAKVREYTTSDFVSAYKPPLALRKSIIDDIGYYYDRDVHWVEDSEFHNRIMEVGLKINYLPNAIIYHPPLTIRTDLRSAFRYGSGKRIGVEKGIMQGVGSRFKSGGDIATKKGLDASLYFLLWNLAYCSGYYGQALFDFYGVKRK